MTSPKTRINVRVSEENLALIREAAELSGQDLTSFVLSASLDRAREVLIEMQVTRLTLDEAKNLENALDREPQPKPALVELLTRALDQDYKGSNSRKRIDT